MNDPAYPLEHVHGAVGNQGEIIPAPAPIPAPIPAPLGQPWNTLSDDEWEAFGINRFWYVRYLKENGRFPVPKRRFWSEIADNWAELRSLPMPVALSWRAWASSPNVPPLWDHEREHVRMRRISYRVWKAVEGNTNRSLSELVIDQLDRAFPRD